MVIVLVCSVLCTTFDFAGIIVDDISYKSFRFDTGQKIKLGLEKLLRL